MGLTLMDNQGAISNPVRDSIHMPEELRKQLYDLMFECAVRVGHMELIGDEWVARPGQTLTQRNFWPAFKAFHSYAHDELGEEYPLPTRRVLEQWRDEMQRGEVVQSDGSQYTVGTINVRLVHIRRLIEAMLSDIEHPALILIVQKWKEIKSLKKLTKADMIETDYGRRLSLEELEDLINAPDETNVLGLRDRAILSLAGGAGLRISEIARLDQRDVFTITDENGQRAILIRNGKHHKQRVVALNGWNSWVLQSVREYLEHIKAYGPEMLDTPVIRGLKKVTGGYADSGERLSIRNVGTAIQRYPVMYNGELIEIEPHDLRRTYAKMCRRAGMSWEALAQQLGHSSVTTTELYVGKEIDWSDRIPNWSVRLKGRKK